MSLEQPKDGETFTTNPAEGDGGLEDQRTFGDMPSVETAGEPSVLESGADQSGTPEVVAGAIEGDNENQEVDPEGEIATIEGSLRANEDNIRKLEEKLGNEEGALSNVRAELGLDQTAQQTLSMEETRTRLAELKEQRERLKDEEEKMETVIGMNEVLERLNALKETNHGDLLIIIETGRDANGDKIKGPDGKVVQPDVAKKLAKYAEDGIKKITKAMLKTIGELVSAVLKGIFKGIFEAVSGQEAK